MQGDADEGWGQGPGILASAWRYRRVVVAALLIGGLLGYLLSAQRPETYEAETRMFLADPRAGGLFDTRSSVDAERYVPQQAARVTSTPVLLRTAEVFGDDLSPEHLERRIEAEGDIELGMIAVTASASTAEQAAALANAAATAYQDVTRELKLEAAQSAAEELREAAASLDEQIQELQAQVDPAAEVDDGTREQIEVLVRQRVDLTSRAQQHVVEARVFGSGVELVEPAPVPDAPASPKPVRDGVLAAVLLGGLAVAVSYWRAGAVNVVEDERMPGRVLDAPLLGTIPLRDKVRGDTLEERLDIDAEVQEAYHLVLASLLHELARSDANSVLITSAESGDGKTEVALQLALAGIVENRDVVLVDGDLRVRRISALVGAWDEPGLVDLRGDQAATRFTRTVPVFQGELTLPVVPAGHDSARRVGVVRRADWSRALRGLQRSVDLTILDSAPILLASDTSVLTSHVDALVLVVREGVALDVLERVRERLSFTGAPLVGYVYVGRQRSGTRLQTGAYGYGRDRRDGVVREPSSRRQGPGSGAPAEPSRPTLAQRDSGVVDRSDAEHVSAAGDPPMDEAGRVRDAADGTEQGSSRTSYFTDGAPRSQGT